MAYRRERERETGASRESEAFEGRKAGVCVHKDLRHRSSCRLSGGVLPSLASVHRMAEGITCSAPGSGKDGFSPSPLLHRRIEKR